MARLVDGALPLQGGALASRLHGYAMSGDATSSTIVRRMMTSVCHPLYAILIRWIMHGELIDTYKEFFIGINQEVSTNGGSLWHDLYFIRSAMLPNFFSKDLAQKILVIGKSFNFLRACIHSGAWEKEALEDGTSRLSLSESAPHASEEDAVAVLTGPSTGSADGRQTKALVLNDEEMRQVETTLRTLRYGDESKLEDLVGRVALLTDERLLKVMMEKAHLVKHLHALKNFMLLGQGDFVTCLMDMVSPELKKRASQLYRHNLTGQLQLRISIRPPIFLTVSSIIFCHVQAFWKGPLGPVTRNMSRRMCWIKSLSDFWSRLLVKYACGVESCCIICIKSNGFLCMCMLQAIRAGRYSH